ncbi:ATP-binding protein [Vibrio lentus]|uniref:ATP-binding protein n=1 Tax=Vibrio lentus TaxID=136468 RepID=UPI000C851B3F|nr:ATP-binding protein [Vibrio lentus]PMM52459.1 hypothetical protein BCT51_17955 [Vibrio lentus]
MAQMSVSARAVDMLGRQQIAGIPTAIHELFKNAHDAYAKNAEIDYYKNQNLITLRDDGVGMTERDFISKWLTIGTSSKYGVNRKSEYIPQGMSERKLMGEKGIGRLAIAAIGRQVVALSRAERKNGMHDMVVALIHWSQFEIPDISISDITIPTRTFPEGKLPTDKDLVDMSKELLNNLNALGDQIPSKVLKLIQEDSKLLTFSPENLFKNLQRKTVENWNQIQEELAAEQKSDRDQPPVLDGLGKGTHFIIMPCDETLPLDVKSNSNGTTELQKILVGFSNALSKKRDTTLQTKFRLHQGSAETKELIEDSFFNLEDAKNADHIVEGSFDEFGQFKGNVTVYKGQPQKHIINWNESAGHTTRCGPFKIKFTYLQGTPSESLVPSDTYVDIKSKLSMYGGLYVYKDGIRVLPYGKQEFDFLRFEEKRSKNAALAFFSHRLMFGAIEIEHDINIELEEKAGREGFRENTAYRQFKSILANFFDQLAIDFFRDSSANDRFSEFKSKFREEANAAKELLKRRKNQVKPKKNKFQTELNEFFRKLGNGDFISTVNQLSNYVDLEFAKASDVRDEIQQYQFVSELRKHVSLEWKNLYSEINISKPNVGLNNDLVKEWESYLKNKQKITAEVFDAEKNRIESLISEYVESNNLSFSIRDRVSDLLEQEKRTLSKSISNYRTELKNNVGEIDSVIKDKARAKSAEYTNALSEVMSAVNSTAIDSLSDEDSAILLSSWEQQLEEINTKTDLYFTKMRDTVELVINDISSDELSSVDLLSALENENEQVKDSLNQYFEFAQLGMSLGIIQHEFGSTAKNVRESIRSLKPWADKNPKLGTLYNSISHSFSHLDGYLKMFTPLNRRLYRSKIDLSGSEIEMYLRDIFQERLSRHDIDLNVSHEFQVKVTRVFPSSFLPVFINVIDNAIYWLNSQLESENPNKFISLDIDDNKLLISNNGPAIATIDEDRIFEFTFSRKSGGRGMGLYISKESLNNEGFDIQLVSGNAGVSACFAISRQV